jgi:hypothetical protein
VPAGQRRNIIGRILAKNVGIRFRPLQSIACQISRKYQRFIESRRAFGRTPGFILALQGPHNVFRFHLQTTLPAIFAFGFFATGYVFTRAPREVEVSSQGLQIRFARATKHLSWSDISWSDLQTQAFTNRKVLTLYGNDGKVVVKLPANLEQFDSLAESIKKRLEDHPSPHASALRWRKSKRSGVMLLMLAIIPLAGSVWLAWMAYATNRDNQLMHTQGVQTEAILVRKFIAPDGRTHRIEYRVAETGEGAPVHNVEIDKLDWTLLQPGAHLPVKTVPGHPEIAELLSGEIKDEVLNPSTTMNVLLSLGVFVMGIMFLVFAILRIKGIDIITDPMTGKLKVERLPK